MIRWAIIDIAEYSMPQWSGALGGNLIFTSRGPLGGNLILTLQSPWWELDLYSLRSPRW